MLTYGSSVVPVDLSSLEHIRLSTNSNLIFENNAE